MLVQSIVKQNYIGYFNKVKYLFYLPGGLAINEAMHAGLPIICSKADGTEKFLVKHKYNGLFFKENNYFDLYENIIYIKR